MYRVRLPLMLHRMYQFVTRIVVLYKILFKNFIIYTIYWILNFNNNFNEMCRVDYCHLYNIVRTVTHRVKNHLHLLCVRFDYLKNIHFN